jgi:hypothetical protein
MKTVLNLRQRRREFIIAVCTFPLWCIPVAAGVLWLWYHPTAIMIAVGIVSLIFGLCGVCFNAEVLFFRGDFLIYDDEERTLVHIRKRYYTGSGVEVNRIRAGDIRAAVISGRIWRSRNINAPGTDYRVYDLRFTGFPGIVLCSGSRDTVLAAGREVSSLSGCLLADITADAPDGKPVNRTADGVEPFTQKLFDLESFPSGFDWKRLRADESRG